MYSGSQLDGFGGDCSGFIAGDPTDDGGATDTEDGWRLEIHYQSIDASDHLSLYSGQVYFTTDVGRLSCPIGNHHFGGHYSDKAFPCIWSPFNEDQQIYILILTL